jgi:hypothetical protein
MFSVRRVVSAVDRTWENVYPTFSSSLGLILLLIEKATHDPLYLWVITVPKSLRQGLHDLEVGYDVFDNNSCAGA